jgi:8-oxo-dGTP pyrophosphatase MutT (NUDIX family)
MSSSSAPNPSRWETLGHTTLATTRIFTLRSTRFRHPRRETARDFVVIDAPDWVNVVALTPDHRMVLVQQFRFGIDGFSLEIPGGVMEVGEEPLPAGARELCEETGYTGRPAQTLGSVHPNPAMQNNRCHFIWVEHAQLTTALAWDPDEEIQVTTLPVDEVYSLARSGAITHGLVLNALLLFEPIWHQIKSRVRRV